MIIKVIGKFFIQTVHKQEAGFVHYKKSRLNVKILHRPISKCFFLLYKQFINPRWIPPPQKKLCRPSFLRIQRVVKGARTNWAAMNAKLCLTQMCPSRRTAVNRERHFFRQQVSQTILFSTSLFLLLPEVKTHKDRKPAAGGNTGSTFWIQIHTSED